MPLPLSCTRRTRWSAESATYSMLPTSRAWSRTTARPEGCRNSAVVVDPSRCPPAGAYAAAAPAMVWTPGNPVSAPSATTRTRWLAASATYSATPSGDTATSVGCRKRAADAAPSAKPPRHPPASVVTLPRARDRPPLHDVRGVLADSLAPDSNSRDTVTRRCVMMCCVMCDTRGAKVETLREQDAVTMRRHGDLE
jgi:hypothetical protein